MEIEIKTIPQYKVAFICKKGSYSQIPETLGKLVGWLMNKKDVQIQMPVYGIYNNNPIEVSEDELDWEVGAAFTGELEEEGEIHVKIIPEHEAVSTIFRGPYSGVATVYMDLIDYATKESYQIAGPIMESYLNSPEYVKENDLLTEVQFPVIKV